MLVTSFSYFIFICCSLAAADNPPPAIEIASDFVLTPEQVGLAVEVTTRLQVHRSWGDQAIYFTRGLNLPVGEHLDAEVSAWILENHPRVSTRWSLFLRSWWLVRARKNRWEILCTRILWELE